MLGFEEVDRLETPLGGFGGEDIHVHREAPDPSRHINYVTDGKLVHMI
jgi:hypothetical protein